MASQAAGAGTGESRAKRRGHRIWLLYPVAPKYHAESGCLRLIFQRFDYPTLRVGDGEFHGQTAIQAVSGAAQSRVIGAYGHFHPVQDALVILAILDEE